MSVYVPILTALTLLPNVIMMAASGGNFGEKEIDRHFRQKPLVLGAHRGGKDMWPENTLLAYKEAARQWPDILLEGDLQLTSDGQVVLMHDHTVDRTTNGTGLVKDKTLAELKALDAGHHFTRDRGKTFPYRGQGVTIPTLAELFEALPEHRYIFELKEGAGLAEAAVEVIRKAGLQERVILASFNPILIQEVKKIAPEIPTCYDYPGAMVLLTTLRQGDWDAYQPTDLMLSVPDNLQSRFNIQPDEIKKIREKGILYQVHTLNRVDEMRAALEYGADSILTDRPDLLHELLSSLSE